MRTLLSIVLFGLISNICHPQVSVEITEKRNIYNKKGDYYFDRKEFKKAISYYNLAYQKDTTDYFSVLKKAEAYTKLGWYPQAELCYRTVFESNQRPKNVYRLRYALVLLANNKTDEFRNWLKLYSEVVDEEIEGENYLVSSEKRLQLYKDTSIVLISEAGKTDTLNFKIRYEGYQFKRSSSEEPDELYVVLSNGDEFAITASGTNDFNFSFQPMENYKLIIQQENIAAEDILNDIKLTPEQRKRKFLNPAPIKKDELLLETGMKYQFSSGKYKISPQYINTLKELAGKYQGSDPATVDLTALVKELQLANGEIYTIRFVRVIDPDDSYKKLEISTVTMNDQTMNIYGQSFLLVLPDRMDENFAIQTDLEVLEKNFSPKKHALVVDDKPLFKQVLQPETEGMLSLSVNTSEIQEVPPENRLSAKEISIIPGTEYILTLSKPDPKTGENLEVIVPLTTGVKYNLSSTQKDDTEFKETLAELLIGREGLELTNEEIIYISVLSKEIEVKPGEELSFNLLPVKQYGKKSTEVVEIKSNLNLDGKVYEITRDQKYSVNVPFDLIQRVNFQTDLAYMQENFEANTYILRMDTVSFTSEISVDTSGYGNLRESGWLVSMSINTDSIEEVEKQNRFTAREVSIIPGKDYILTVSKVDGETGEVIEIIVPLTRNIKYDFTSNPASEDAYRESLNKFLAGRDDIETIDGEVIDIRLISKELQIKEGDEISFSLLPVRQFKKPPTPEPEARSSLYLDSKLVEFTQIQKFTINVPLTDERKMNMQTDLEHLQENFEPNSFTLDIDTLSFFSEITVDTTGYGDRVLTEEIIKDPVFDVVVVNFDLNEYALSPLSKNIIQGNVIDKLQEDKRLYVTIKGYTDALGDPGYNLNLSKKRAESVKEFLKSKGIGENRIRTFSFGASQLLEKNINWKELDESELRKYRKVEIVIYLPK